MSFKKYSKNVLFAKKHTQNLTFESVVLSIQILKKARYPSSLVKKCFVVFSQLICLQKVGIFLATPKQLRLTCYLVSNFEHEINIFSYQLEAEMKI